MYLNTRKQSLVKIHYTSGATVIQSFIHKWCHSHTMLYLIRLITIIIQTRNITVAVINARPNSSSDMVDSTCNGTTPDLGTGQKLLAFLRHEIRILCNKS
jgi:hypothetical protein